MIDKSGREIDRAEPCTIANKYPVAASLVSFFSAYEKIFLLADFLAYCFHRVQFVFWMRIISILFRKQDTDARTRLNFSLAVSLSGLDHLSVKKNI